MDIGNGQIVGEREIQEDYFASLVLTDRTILILADGVGGLNGGEIASVLAVEAVFGFLQTADFLDTPTTLVEAVHKANAHIASADSIDGGMMGTTLVIAVIEEAHIHWVSVGDSIISRWREGVWTQLNTPHTRMQELNVKVAAGVISASQAQADPERERITSALMGIAIPHIEVKSLPHELSDRIIVASDGIQTLNYNELQRLVGGKGAAADLIGDLLQAVEAKQDTYQDNCTVLLAMPDKHAAKPRKYWCLAIISLLLVLITAGTVFWNNKSETTVLVPEKTGKVRQSSPDLSLKTQLGSALERGNEDQNNTKGGASSNEAEQTLMKNSPTPNSQPPSPEVTLDVVVQNNEPDGGIEVPVENNSPSPEVILEISPENSVHGKSDGEEGNNGGNIQKNITRRYYDKDN